KGFDTDDIDDWAADDLLGRHPNELLVCRITRNVTQLATATCQSYGSGVQYLARVVPRSNRGERRRLYLICDRCEARDAGQNPLVFCFELPRRRMGYYPQRADRLSLSVKRHHQRFNDREIDRHTVEVPLRIREQERGVAIDHDPGRTGLTRHTVSCVRR